MSEPVKPTRLQKLKSGIAALPGKAYHSSISKGTGEIITGVSRVAVGTAALPFRAAAIPIAAVQGVGATAAIPFRNTFISRGMGAGIDYLKEKANQLDEIPSFYKILFLIFFYAFFYKIIYDIGIFFGLNSTDLVIYMAWFGILLLFLSFIRSTRSRLYN